MSPMAEPTNGHEDPHLEPIVICGMACRLPGGVDSDSSFWRMLVEKRSGQTPKVPKSRFNIDAHLHEDPERPGSFNVAGGYFLDGRLEDFDPTFFNMTPIEAQWLDPQQRKMLEVSYECLVSAGVTLQSVAGTNTAVFVGSFTSDYQQMSIRDPDFRHNYAATGVDPGIISNRIGNTFNLKGPSFTINTACSSSVYALHNACHALRSRDCDAAIVGGVNLILTVDQHMNTAKLGILSPTSTCHTFDESADGYGRAEGAGALYVKRLTDAIRDGDPIRGVIRSTAVNTNGKVEGMGITHPSAAGQERVVRMAYDKAKLDPNDTIYAELHGTGTPVGDPIEVKAVSHALNDTRPKDRPLLLGAVKPNIGHSEAASGIFAVMKASMMTEAALIPGVAYFNKLNPNISEAEWNVKIHTNTAPWPNDSVLRRASVSSFGYGGTNGHVIVESIETLYPWYKHAKARADASYDRSSKKPFLLCFSAHDKSTLSRNVKAIGGVASKYYLTDLAHTLNLHRTLLSHRAFTVAYEGREAEAFESSALQIGAPSTKAKSIGFLFTGQGAQWVGMARAALHEYPIIMDAIQRLDLILGRLQPKPSFKIADLLLENDESKASKINEAEISQPLCTAIQIALVDLFCQWDIEPTVSIGHSSGEIGAAYAAGLVSAPEAIIAAFCRGRAVAHKATSGSMLAVGMGVDEVQDFLPSAPEDACIACENSPNSVTLSGKAESISALRDQLSSNGVFARELRTGKAYHSPHMAPVGTAYEIMLSEALVELNEDDLLWRRPRSQMISSVTGEPVTEDFLPVGYWSANLRQRVLFNAAIQCLGADSQFGQVNFVVEVGPHSALSAPFKQTCVARGFERFTYVPSLVRNKNDAVQLLSVAGSLFLAGYPVDLQEVNWTASSDNKIRKPTAENILVDLPPYQWNYEKQYWAEPRGSAEQRARLYPRHDLLGSRISGLTTNTQVWRNVLRHRDIPWLKDHNLGGTAIFPAAGYLSIAIEALRQVHETEEQPFEGVTLRDVNIKTALVIPDNNDGVETILRLQTATDGSEWSSFAAESFADGVWTVHCEGRISAVHKPTVRRQTPVNESALTQRVAGKRWYDAFDRVGFYYGKTFQQLQSVRTDRTVHHATGNVTVAESSGIMQGESRYLIHPSTVDACLQLIIISIHSGRHKEVPWGVVPTRIEEVSLFPAEHKNAATGHAVAWTDDHDEREFNTNVRLKGPEGNVIMDIKNLICITYDAAIPASSLENETGPEPFSINSWKPDIMNLTHDALELIWPNISSGVERLGKLVELVRHRQHVTKILICGSPAPETVQSVLNCLPINVNITLGFDGEQELHLLEESKARTIVRTLPENPKDWLQATDGPHGLVVVDYSSHHPGNPVDGLMPLVNDGGCLLGLSQQFATLPNNSLQLGELFVLFNNEVHTNGTTTKHDDVTFLSLEGGQGLSPSRAVSASPFEATVHEKLIQHFSPEQDIRVVIDDTTGTLLSAMTSNAETFESVKAVLTSGVRTLWLTQGVKQGQSASAGMAEGLIRAIRSEQAAARIVLLDIDHGETSEDVGKAIISMLDAADTKDSGHDTEFWLHKGCLHISRVYPYDSLHQNENKAPEKFLPRDLLLKANTVDGQLILESDSKRLRLSDNEVEVQVLASELQKHTSRSQLLVCGQVLRVGSAVDQSVVGRRIVALSYDGLATMVYTSAYALLDEDEHSSPETLLSALMPLYPIVNLCLFRNKLAPSDFVLSLPGPESFTTAIANLAQAIGWNLTIVVNSLEEKEKYTSQFGFRPDQVLLSNDVETMLSVIRDESNKSASGVVDVLAYEFSSLTQEIWRCIPAFCRLLVTNSSSEATPDSLPFKRGASFLSSTLKSLRASPKSAASLLTLSLQVLRTYSDVFIERSDSEIKTIDVADAGNITGHTEKQNEEKRVVRFGYGESQVEIVHKAAPVRFSSEAIYLLVGCLGGLGRSLTRWMNERGAKRFAFISRSGADKPDAARLVENLRESGATTQVFRADASDEEAVRRIVVELNENGGIRGVVHAATIFKDGMFEHMDHASFASCLTAKAHSALSLHHAVQDLDLDFFVMTSSISALLGNTGQSNYSAANSVLDALALQRSSNHLPATSLVLPMVLDVGVVAENAEIETSLARKGLYGIDELDMLHGFEKAMFRPRVSPHSGSGTGEDMGSQVIMGMEARELARSMASIENVDAYWYGDARFCHIKAAIAHDEGQVVGSGSTGFAATINDASPGGPEAILTATARYIAKRMSTILMIPVDDFELDGPSLGSYGLDSMIGAEMRTWIFKEFGLDYPFQKLLAPTLTFKGLAGVVAEKMELGVGAAP